MVFPKSANPFATPSATPELPPTQSSHLQANSPANSPANPQANPLPGGAPGKQTPSMDLRQRVSIRTLIILLFWLQTMAAIGLTGWLSILNSQRAVQDLAKQLQTQANEVVTARLNNFLNVPRKINQLNVSAIELGILQVTNFDKLGTYFARQMQSFEEVGYINFANESGQFVGVERDGDALWVNDASNRAEPSALSIYATDEEGYRTALEEVINDPSKTVEEGWYADAVEAQRPVWSEIYQWDDNPNILSISSSSPVYNASEELIGVVGVDLLLTQISDFLNQVKVSPSAKIFIIERDFKMVASSDNSPIYKVFNGKAQRFSAEEMSDPLIRGAAAHLKQGNLESIKSSQFQTFKLNGEKQFLQVTPWQDNFGLNWLTVVAVPESDFTAQAMASIRRTVLLCLLLMLAASLLGLWLSRWLTEPIEKLGKAARAIANGDLDQRVDDSGVGELGLLGASFNQMTEQLQTSFRTLASSNTQLEHRVSERTAALAQSSEALEMEVAHLLDVVGAVEGGDLTVAATVSSMTTGLVADTLNRLIEQLNQVMSQVGQVAIQMGQEGQQLERFVGDVAHNTEQQVAAIAPIQTLLSTLDSLSQKTAEQASESCHALERSGDAVDQQTADIAAMGEAVTICQRGTQQILQRSQALSDYVALATQFTQAQKRAVAMMQVLALNAARLSKQVASASPSGSSLGSDAQVDQELAAIAQQMSELASQTGQSLAGLTEQSDQMQTVINGLQQDLQGVNQQVSQLASRLMQSQTRMESVSLSRQQVMDLAQQLAATSQRTTVATASTLQATHAVSALVEETAQQVNSTREQSGYIESLAQALLEQIGMFKLQPDKDDRFSMILEAQAETIMTPMLSAEQNGHSVSNNGASNNGASKGQANE
jgi:methyl-accepting chemotaxis protein